MDASQPDTGLVFQQNRHVSRTAQRTVASVDDDPIQNFLLQREDFSPRLRADTELPFIPDPAPPAATAVSSPSPASPLSSDLTVIPALDSQLNAPAATAPVLVRPSPVLVDTEPSRESAPTAAIKAEPDPAAPSSIAQTDGVPPSQSEIPRGREGPTGSAASPALVAVPPDSPPAPANRPRDAESPLGVGDQVAVTVFGQPDLSAEVTISESGLIMLPLIGSLNVLSLTPSQLEHQVARRLKDGGYLVNPAVAVQVRQVRSQLISVMGEVQRPGRYPIQGRMTVLEALAIAGGLTPRADRQISLLRKTRAADGPADASAVREEIKISLDAIGGPAAGQADAELRNDDVILVGVQKQFYVHGQVRRPGAYPLEPGMNVMKALALGGGVTERGSVRRVRIHREAADGSGIKEFPAELTTPVQANDVIHVDERLF